MTTQARSQTVAVAMSGGVDSSVAAAILKDQGYNVLGFFGKTWTPTPGDGTQCTWVAERRDALRVAAHLNIPLITVDLEPAYRADVVEPLFRGYAAGQTPNPDVLCNKEVKFKELWQAAQAHGAEYFATGHYAQIVHSSAVMDERWPKILRGQDSHKDQSYFLWAVDPKMLNKVVFPIGGYTKAQVRELAKKYQLPVATKKDSQGICFLGPTDLSTFLKTRIHEQYGPIIHSITGETIGFHPGTTFFTIGQRHGFGHTGSTDVLYVVARDHSANRLYVGSEEALWRSWVGAEGVQWLIAGFAERLASGSRITAMAQIRYREAATPVELTWQGEYLSVQFAAPVFAPAAGQSIVFYSGNQLLGGAIINTVHERDFLLALPRE